jgi:DNA-binding MarR family transcriptional regulator
MRGIARRSQTTVLRKADYEILAQFRSLLRQFTSFSERAAHAAGLTPQHHQALLAIKGFPGREQITIGELAERLNVRHHSVVGLVNRLVSQRLCERRTDLTDRRRVLIELTSRAEGILADLTLAHRDELRRLTPVLRALLSNLEGRGAP